MVGAPRDPQRSRGPASAGTDEAHGPARAVAPVLQVTLDGGGEEPFGRFAALKGVDAVVGPPFVDVPAGAAGEPARPGLGTAEERRDVPAPELGRERRVRSVTALFPAGFRSEAERRHAFGVLPATRRISRRMPLPLVRRMALLRRLPLLQRPALVQRLLAMHG